MPGISNGHVVVIMAQCVHWCSYKLRKISVRFLYYDFYTLGRNNDIGLYCVPVNCTNVEIELNFDRYNNNS